MKIIKCQKGAAAVEFAIIAPLLFTIMFGIIEFGLLFYDKAVITNASREGARYGILWGTNRPSVAEIEAKVASYTTDRLITFGSAEPPTTTVVGIGGVAGEDLTVTVVYQNNFLLIPNFVDTLLGVTTLSARTIMRFE